MNQPQASSNQNLPRTPQQNLPQYQQQQSPRAFYQPSEQYGRRPAPQHQQHVQGTIPLQNMAGNSNPAASDDIWGDEDDTP